MSTVTQGHQVPSQPVLRQALRDLAACSSRLPIRADETASELEDAGWTRADRLADAGSWPTIAREYADGLGGAAPAVGGSCALQGYAWRVAGLALGTWALTGAVIDLAAERLWVDLRGGRTLGIAAPAPRVAPGGGAATPDDLATALHGHLAPVVAASCSVSRISSRVAWGNVASSCASVLGLLDRARAPHERGAWRAAASAVLSSPAWPHAGLVAPLLVPDGADDALHHERATCCLIRLAPDHEPCASCSRLDADVRRARLRESVRSTPAPRRLRATAIAGPTA